MLGDLPPGITQARLAELIQRLRPECKGVGVRLDEINDVPLDPAQHPVAIAAFEATTLLRAHANHASAVEHFLREIRQSHARVLARHVVSPAQVLRVKALGVDLLSFAE
jgi:hypothetical protein